MMDIDENRNRYDKYKKLLIYSSAFSIMCMIIFVCAAYVNLPENIEWCMVYCLLVLCPIPFIVLWIITLVFYLSMEFENLGAQGTFWRKLAVIISIIPVICFCITFFCQLNGLANYITYRWSYIEKLYDCLVIKIGMVIGWLLCWIISVRKKKIIAAKGNVWQKLILFAGGALLLTLLVYVDITTKEYIYERTEDAWYENMVETYAEEHGLTMPY